MTSSFEKRIGLFFKATVILAILLTGQPATGHATLLSGTDIPLIDGARIVKEKQFQGSGRFEFEVDMAPAAAIEFYHRVMQARGWPAGRILSVGTTRALMLLHQGSTFSVKADDKAGRTYVTLAVVLKSSIEKALDPQTAQRHSDTAKLAAASKEKTLPENSIVTIEGSPIGKGELIRRPRLPGRDGSDVGKKDDGNLPDDPSPPSDDDDPDAEDSSSDDASNTGDALDARNDLPERLSVSIHAFVRWNVTNPNEDAYTGTINLHFNGNMRIVEAKSPTVHGALGAIQPTLTYKPENGTVSFAYEEHRISLKPIPSGKCQDPLMIEYQGGGVMPLSEESVFKVHRYSASASPYLRNLSADKQRFLSTFKSNTAVPDGYELMLGPGGTKKRIHGRKKDPGETACAYIPVYRDFPGCRIGIQVELPASGILAGSRTWSADDQGLCPPSLGISILDIAATQNKKPLKPPSGGNNNVTYKVNWRIGEAVAAPREDSPTVENRDQDCANMRTRAEYIQIVRAAYGNQAVRDALKKIAPDESTRKRLYQDVIERLVTDAANHTDLTISEKIALAASAGETDVDGYLADSATSMPVNQTTLTDKTLEDANAQTWLNTCPIFDKQGHFLGTEIRGRIGGRTVVLEKYDKNGELAQRVDPDGLLSEWEASNGKWAGRSLLDNALHHERVHVRQYTKVQGQLKTMDLLGDWELEAYRTELDGLLNDIDEDC